MDGKKECTICGFKKTFSEFYLLMGGKFGRSPYCKECHSAKNVKWNREHPQVIRNGRQKYRRKHKLALNEKSRKYVKNLGVSYVKRMILAKYGIHPEDISQQMIDREREVIKLNRALKEKLYGNAKNTERTRA